MVVPAAPLSPSDIKEGKRRVKLLSMVGGQVIPKGRNYKNHKHSA